MSPVLGKLKLISTSALKLSSMKQLSSGGFSSKKNITRTQQPRILYSPLLLIVDTIKVYEADPETLCMQAKVELQSICRDFDSTVQGRILEVITVCLFSFIYYRHYCYG
jgi:hypothetical protein